MRSIQKKLGYYFKKHPKGYHISISGVVACAFLLAGAFFVTKGSRPYASELAIIEHSTLGISAGSVLPASGESYPTYGYESYGYESYGYESYGYESYGYESYGYQSYGYDNGGGGPTYGYPSYGYESYGTPSYGYESYGYESYGYESYPSYPSYSGPSTIATFNITPRSVERGGLVSISWSIYHPSTSCKIVAEVQKPAVCDAGCQTARDTASTTLNTLLSSGNTNANDPNGSRPMLTALRQALNNPSGYSRGVKSVNLEYSTTFTARCANDSVPVRSIIYVTDRTEG